MSSVELFREAMDEDPPEQSRQGGLRPPAEPPQADKAAIGSMARGALSCLVVARWGLHGSNSAEGYPSVSPQANMGGIRLQGVPFLDPEGARWGHYGLLANEISRHFRTALMPLGGSKSSRWGGIQYCIMAAVRAEIGLSGGGPRRNWWNREEIRKIWS